MLHAFVWHYTQAYTNHRVQDKYNDYITICTNSINDTCNNGTMINIYFYSQWCFAPLHSSGRSHLVRYQYTDCFISYLTTCRCIVDRQLITALNSVQGPRLSTLAIINVPTLHWAQKYTHSSDERVQGPPSATFKWTGKTSRPCNERRQGCYLQLGSMISLTMLSAPPLDHFFYIWSLKLFTVNQLMFISYTCWPCLYSEQIGHSVSSNFA